jgi:hypothetical protein
MVRFAREGKANTRPVSGQPSMPPVLFLNWFP